MTPVRTAIPQSGGIDVDLRGSCGHSWTVHTTRVDLIPYAGDAPAPSHVPDHRARFRCPECGILATVVQRVTKRRCACGAWLSRYNRDDTCGPCQFEEKERLAARNAREAQVPVTVPGTLTARILGSLPGTIPGIAETLGEPHARVERIVRALAEQSDGRVVSDGLGGGKGRWAVYRLADREALVKSAPA